MFTGCQSSKGESIIEAATSVTERPAVLGNRLKLFSLAVKSTHRQQTEAGTSFNMASRPTVFVRGKVSPVGQKDQHIDNRLR